MKQELINTITTLEKQLAEAKEKLSKCDEQWHPKGGEWTVSMEGNKVFCSSSTAAYKLAGLESQTEEAAKKKLKAIRQFARLYSLAEELNKGWEPNWRNTDEGKWVLDFDHRTGQWGTNVYNYLQYGCIFFKSKFLAEKAIELITNNNVLETNG